MLIVERNVQENVLDVFLPFMHPELFQWYNSWLTIFFSQMCTCCTCCTWKIDDFYKFAT